MSIILYEVVVAAQLSGITERCCKALHWPPRPRPFYFFFAAKIAAYLT